MSSLDTALANCLLEMAAGQSMEDCLSRFGEQAAELRTLLTLASDVRDVPVPRARPEARAAQQRNMMAALETMSTAPTSQPRLLERLQAGLGLRPALRWATVMTVVLILLVGGGWASVTAAANSLPGDILHPVKRAGEWVQISLTIDHGAREQLREEFFWERIEETQEILEEGRPTEVAFAGSLTELTDDFWRIEGFYVYLGPDTVILGEPAAGRQVQVRAQAQGDGELLALRLQVEIAAEPGQRPDSGASPTPTPMPTSSPSPMLSPIPTSSPPSGETADPEPTPSSTPAPTSVRPADREEKVSPATSTPVPTWLQRFRRTPHPRSTRPMAVPSLTPKPRERLRLRYPTTVASPPKPRLRTRMPEDTPATEPLSTRTPVPTLSQPPSHTRQPEPEPARTGMPEKPPSPKPEQTREPEPERPKDPGPEPPRPRPRSTKRP